MSRRRTIGAITGGVAALAVGVAPALAAPAPAPTATVPGAATLGRDVSLVSSAASSQPVSFRINLDLRDGAAAEAYATAVSTPGSALAGRFLSEDQFQARFGPRPEQVASLCTWLTSRHIDVEQVIGSQIVVAGGSAGDVAAAFSTRIANVRSAAGNVDPSAVTPLRVPSRFAGLVGGISGLRPATAFVSDRSTVGSTVAFSSRDPEPAVRAAAPARTPCPTSFGQVRVTGVPRPPFSTQFTSYQECSRVLNPFTGQPASVRGASTAKLKRLSNVNRAYTGRGVTVGIVLWNNDARSERLADIGARTNGTHPLRAGQLTSSITGAGASNCQPVSEGDKVEIALDVQSVHAFAPDANIRYYGSSRCVVPDVSLATALAEKAPPSVVNNSWGTPNNDYDATDPTDRSLHSSLVKAAVRGVTVLFSTGDTGDGSLLRSNYPEVSPPAPYPARVPGYPATDPYAVAVGGVGFGTAANGLTAFRQAWIPSYFSNSPGRPTWAPVTLRNLGAGPNAIGTSGGTSISFPAPAWQKSAGVSSTARKVPDIANAADSFFGPEIVALYDPAVGDYVSTVSGTSMAAPLTAGQVATSNEYRRNRYLGLITPSLYRLRASTTVSDVGRAQNAVVVPGYPFADGSTANLLVGGERGRESLVTARGWDDATGLGTPGTGFIGNIGR